MTHWENSGLGPRPIRRWRDGAPAPLYPEYAIAAIAHLRELQEAGRPLDQIAQLMRAWALSPIQWEDPLSRPLTNARAALVDLARALNVEVNSIAVVFKDNGGAEVWAHEIPVPADLKGAPPRV